MPNKAYNEIAGRSVERLAALSDGLFAIAMTLLIIDLHAPVSEAIHSEAELWQALGRLAPPPVRRYTAYCWGSKIFSGQMVSRPGRVQRFRRSFLRVGKRPPFRF